MTLLPDVNILQVVSSAEMKNKKQCIKSSAEDEKYEDTEGSIYMPECFCIVSNTFVKTQCTTT